MKSLYKVLFGVFSSLSVGLGAFPVVAQSYDEPDSMSVFTDEEREIISQELEIEPFPDSYYDYKRLFGRSPRRILNRGGSGLDRWVVFSLGTDEFGNHYSLNTQEKIRFDYGIQRDVNGNLIPIYDEYPVIRVIYANPQPNGAVLRRIGMTTSCKSWRKRRNGYRYNDHPKFYEDYDSNQELIDSGTYSFSRSERQEMNGTQHGSIRSYIQAACYVQHAYPIFVELLVRGENRTSPAPTPSIFDRL